MFNLKDIVFILGMHRSGTSATTRLINLLGADLGRNLLAGDPEVNKKGFWENLNLITIHDEILASLDTAWYDFRELPNKWWKKNELTSFLSKTINVLKNDFDNPDMILIKDPRICRLLPFWLKIVENTGGKAHCIIVMRNPLEVVRSIEKRDEFSRLTAIYLWLTYTLDAELYSRQLPRTVVKFDATLNDWEKTVNQITENLGIRWPNEIDQIRETAEQELDPSLRHHTIQNPVENQDALIRLSNEIYEKMTEHPLTESRKFLDQIRDDLYRSLKNEEKWAEALFHTNKALFESKKKFRQIRDHKKRGLIKNLRINIGRILKPEEYRKFIQHD